MSDHISLMDEPHTNMVHRGFPNALVRTAAHAQVLEDCGMLSSTDGARGTHYRPRVHVAPAGTPWMYGN
jgi:hypothetical protein